MGFILEDDELQTTPGAAARELSGKRVLALVMPAVVPDLDGLELVGDHAEAVLIGGCDETLEPNQVFSYMNLARAFDEIQMGASLFCLHKNKWWQTSRGPMLDSGAFVAGLEYATDVEATVLGKPSPVVLRGRARRARRGAGADVARHGRRRRRRSWGSPLRDEDRARADGQVPARGAGGGGGVAGHRRLVPRAVPRAARGGPDRRPAAVKVGVDIIEIERIERALERPGFRERCFTDGRARVLRFALTPGAELRGTIRRQGGCRQSARLRCAVHVEGDRDRRAAEAGCAAFGANRSLRGASAGGADRPLDDALARDRSRDRRREPALRWLRATSRSTAPPRCERPRSGTPDIPPRSRSSWSARAQRSRARRCSPIRPRAASRASAEEVRTAETDAWPLASFARPGMSRTRPTKGSTATTS